VNPRYVERMTPTVTRELAEIGATVRRMREERGLLVQELAEKAGVTRWTITNVEAGHVRAKGATLGRIALALGVPLSDITEGDRP
jgi:transcriptional regulator with XRE-family HTH domain